MKSALARWLARFVFDTLVGGRSGIFPKFFSHEVPPVRVTGCFVPGFLHDGAVGAPAHADSLQSFTEVYQIGYLAFPDGKCLRREFFPESATFLGVGVIGAGGVDAFEHHDEDGCFPGLTWVSMWNPLFQYRCWGVRNGSAAGDDRSEQCAESE